MPDIDYKTRSRNGGNAQNQTGAWRATGKATGERYRYIEDKPQDGANGANADGANANEPVAAAKTRSCPNAEYVLYAYGEPVGTNSDNEISYFGTDILGSVRSVTDRNGQVKASYEYDAFGTPYLANLENDVGFGYTGKAFDSATGLYDYGFRDYAPNSARFTTIDPVRDGSNWFSYVVNDPVNFIDPFGLSATDAGNTSKIASWWSNAKATVKGWGQEIVSDVTQTWNDIKNVALTAFTNTQTAVSNFISNTQSNLSKWDTQAKADFTQLWNDIKSGFENIVKDNTDYKIINNSTFTHIEIPDDDDTVTVEKLIIVGGTESPYKEDAVYCPETGILVMASNGYSIIITDTINENGIKVPLYDFKNEGRGIYRILAFLGKLTTGKSGYKKDKTYYDINNENCPQEIKDLIGESEAQGKVQKAINSVNY